MAHPKHAMLRERYQFRCGYCGVSEAESGGELTVDHYHPVSAGGDDSEENLIYCCFRCNTYKADFFPTAHERDAGFRVLHPFEDIGGHLHENEQSSLLEPLTVTGRFHIELLHLNRPQQVELRSTRRLQRLLAEACDFLRHDNEQLRQQILIVEQYLRELHLK